MSTDHAGSVFVHRYLDPSDRVSELLIGLLGVAGWYWGSHAHTNRWVSAPVFPRSAWRWWRSRSRSGVSHEDHEGIHI